MAILGLPPSEADPIVSQAEGQPPEPKKPRGTAIDAAKEELKKTVNCSINLNEITDRFLSILYRYNLSEAVGNEVFVALKYWLPDLPSFGMVRKIAAERTHVRLNEYPICRNECSYLSKQYGDLSPNERATLTCPKCQLPYIQTGAQLEFRKVSTHSVEILLCCGFSTSLWLTTSLCAVPLVQ